MHEEVEVVESLVVFFSSRRRHTRYWRDWSSDVCSSDLPRAAADLPASDSTRWRRHPARTDPTFPLFVMDKKNMTIGAVQIGRASCRERVYVSGVGVRFTIVRGMVHLSREGEANELGLQG